MGDLKFLKKPAPRVLVDIEALYDFNKVILERHEKEFGAKFPPTWTGTEFPLTRNLSTKYAKRLIPYFKEAGFYSNLEVEDYALRGLFRMKTLGFDVYIVISLTASHIPALNEQLVWLEKKLPESWMSKILVSRDKTLLSADYLIDVQPNTSESFDLFKKRGSSQFSQPTVQVPSWKLILIDRPFNMSDTSAFARFPVWKQWTKGFTEVLNLDLRDSIVSYAHGSPNSLDLDRMYIFPAAYINGEIGDKARALLDDGIVDVNLLDFDEDGYVCENHKGLNDEIHNALTTTWPLHVQRFPLPSNMGPRVQRAVALKYFGGLRRIFIRLTELEITRSEMKQTLRNHDPTVASPAFGRLDFTTILRATGVDHTKTFAFQMGQIMGLFDGVDLFTKNDIVRLYPALEPFIMRKRDQSLEESHILNEFRDQIQAKASKMEILVGPHQTGLLQVHSSMLQENNPTSWNSLLEQANGMVIDFKDLTIVAFPPSHQMASTPLQWPRDPGCTSDFAILPNFESVSIGKESHGHIIASNRQCFDSPKCRAVLEQVCHRDSSLWPWKSRYFFFELNDQGELVLVAARSKFSHLFLNREKLNQLSKELCLNPSKTQ